MWISNRATELPEFPGSLLSTQEPGRVRALSILAWTKWYSLRHAFMWLVNNILFAWYSLWLKSNVEAFQNLFSLCFLENFVHYLPQIRPCSAVFIQVKLMEFPQSEECVINPIVWFEWLITQRENCYRRGNLENQVRLTPVNLHTAVPTTKSQGVSSQRWCSHWMRPPG